MIFLSTNFNGSTFGNILNENRNYYRDVFEKCGTKVLI